jgi:molybdopterin-biosynthesis enzyme MoeA-like protein
MRMLLEHEVLPRLASRAGGQVVRSRTVRTTAIPESTLADRLGDIEQAVAPAMIAYLPGVDGVDLRLTVWGLAAAEADVLLTEGLGIVARETRPRFHGEEQLWRYKRGGARAALGRDDAVQDLQFAAASDALTWVAGRARVELSNLALKRGDRAAAAAEAAQAETLCLNGNDPPCVEQAKALQRRARGR